MKKRIWFRALALMLALVICVMSPIRAYATGAEGAIIGGVTGGLALSAPQVALLLLAAFGVCYAVENKDEIAVSLNNALDDALDIQTKVFENDIAQQEATRQNLIDWWEKAKTGAINMSTAPTWISDAIKGWADGFIKSETAIEIPISGALPSGTIVTSGTKIYAYADSYQICYADTIVLKGRYTDSSGSERILILPISTSVFNYTTQSGITYKAGGPRTVNGVQYYMAGSDLPLSRVDSSALAGSIYFGSGYTSGKYATMEALISAWYGNTYTDITPSTESLYPDVITGGIANQINSGVDMTVIGVPDIQVPGADVLPVSPSDGQTTEDSITEYLLTALINGEITWEMYWKLIGVLNPTTGTASPTVTLTDTTTGAVAGEYELTDTGVSSAPVVAPVIGDFTMDLTGFFPFCIPFDIYEFLSILAAEPEAPVFHWEIPVPQLAQTFEIDVDLSAWNDVAQLFRDLELLAFIVGLAMITRDKILRG